MTRIFVSVLFAVCLGNAIANGDIQGYIKDLEEGVMQRFDGLEESNKALLKELHQVEDALGRTSTTDNKQDATCKDHHHGCSKFAKKGYCKKKGHFMLKTCPKSCDACGNKTTPILEQRKSRNGTDATCKDHLDGCPILAKKGYCKKKAHFMLKTCPKSCDVCGNKTTPILEKRKSRNGTGAPSHKCSWYAKKGYCKTKADKMLKKCPKSCNACEYVFQIAC